MRSARAWVCAMVGLVALAGHSALAFESQCESLEGQEFRLFAYKAGTWFPPTFSQTNRIQVRVDRSTDGELAVTLDFDGSSLRALVLGHNVPVWRQLPGTGAVQPFYLRHGREQRVQEHFFGTTITDSRVPAPRGLSLNLHGPYWVLTHPEFALTSHFQPTHVYRGLTYSPRIDAVAFQNATTGSDVGGPLPFTDRMADVAALPNRGVLVEQTWVDSLIKLLPEAQTDATRDRIQRLVAKGSADIGSAWSAETFIARQAEFSRCLAAAALQAQRHQGQPENEILLRIATQ